MKLKRDLLSFSIIIAFAVSYLFINGLVLTDLCQMVIKTDASETENLFEQLPAMNSLSTGASGSSIIFQSDGTFIMTEMSIGGNGDRACTNVYSGQLSDPELIEDNVYRVYVLSRKLISSEFSDVREDIFDFEQHPDGVPLTIYSPEYSGDLEQFLPEVGIYSSNDIKNKYFITYDETPPIKYDGYTNVIYIQQDDYDLNILKSSTDIIGSEPVTVYLSGIYTPPVISHYYSASQIMLSALFDRVTWGVSDKEVAKIEGISSVEIDKDGNFEVGIVVSGLMPGEFTITGKDRPGRASSSIQLSVDSDLMVPESNTDFKNEGTEGGVSDIEERTGVSATDLDKVKSESVQEEEKSGTSGFINLKLFSYLIAAFVVIVIVIVLLKKKLFK